MKNYYIRQQDKKLGPYSVDQLREMQINPVVQVWAGGLKRWISAEEIPELQQALFLPSPAFVPGNSSTKNEHFNPKTEKTGFVAGRNRKTAFIIFALIIIGFLIIILQTSESYSPVFKTATLSAKTPVQLRNERRKKEISHPTDYLKAKTSWRKNLVGETVLEGTLHNTANRANFKDPVLLITWLSRTNTPLGTNSYPLYEYLGAGKTISYKLKMRAPSKFANVQVSVESATSVQ